jgi:co-chaperonin GroES (HSP10)
MKAIGRYLIIDKFKEKTTKTEGGLLLSVKDKEDIRYTGAHIISVGDQVQGLKKDDQIYFDRHAGHKVEFKEKIFHVIKDQDVVVVL